MPVRQSNTTTQTRFFNILACTTYALLGIYFTANQTLVNGICSEYQQGSAAMGVMIGLFFFGMVVSALVMGELGERTGKKFTICCGLIAIVLGVLVVGLSASFVVACIGLFVSGTGFGTVESMIGSATADANPKNPERAMNIAQAFFSAGAVASPLVIGAFIKRGGDWRMVYYAVAGLTVLLFIAAFRLAFGARPPKSHATKGFISFSLLKKPVFVLYLVMIMIYVGAESGVAFWVVRYFNEVALSPVFGEISLSVFWAGTMLARLAVVRIKNHRLLMVIGFAVAALGTALFVFMPSPALKIASVLLAAIGMGPIWPTMFILGSRQHAHYSSAAFGVMMVASSMGGTLIQPAIGKIVEGAPVSAAYWTIAALCLAMAMLMIFTIGLDNRKTALEKSV